MTKHVYDADRDFDCVPDGTPRHDSLANVKVAFARLGIERGQHVDSQALFKKIARRFGFLPLPHVRRDAMRWLNDAPLGERKNAKPRDLVATTEAPAITGDTLDTVHANRKVDPGDGRDFRRLPDGSIDARWGGNFHLAVMRLGIKPGSIGDPADVLARVERRFGFMPNRRSRGPVFMWLNLQKAPRLNVS